MWHALDYQTFSQFTPYLPLAKNDCIFSFKEKDDDEAKEEGRVGGRRRGEPFCFDLDLDSDRTRQKS